MAKRASDPIVRDVRLRRSDSDDLRLGLIPPLECATTTDVLGWIEVELHGWLEVAQEAFWTNTREGSKVAEAIVNDLLGLVEACCLALQTGHLLRFERDREEFDWHRVARVAGQILARDAGTARFEVARLLEALAHGAQPTDSGAA